MNEEQKDQQPINIVEPQVTGNVSEPQPEQKPAPTASRTSRWHRFRTWYGSHKKWTIAATALLLLIVLAVMPWSRYQAAGLVLKNEISLKITDSTANTPVSGALVTVGNISATTDGDGVAKLSHIKVGNHTALVTKKYYEDQRVSLLVPIRDQKAVPEIKFVATGRQAKIAVKNMISKKPLSDVDIKMADTTAKTDKNGEATVVLPVGSTETEVTLSLEGYNESKVKVQASATEIKQNDFTLTPAGKVYFLSKLSGRIDVVKTSLDGSGRKTVLAGTGNEDDEDTVLLASRDWKYLALKANRSGGGPVLYIIDTASDQLSAIDQTSGDFFPIAWKDGYLIYELYREHVDEWRSGQDVFKSYHAPSGKLTLLNQTKGSGSDSSNYAREIYQASYLADGNLVFEKFWDFGCDASKSSVDQASAGIYSIGLDGQNFRTLKAFNYKLLVEAEEENCITASYYDFSGFESKPGTIVYRLYDSETPDYKYYRYSGGQVAENSSLAKTFSKDQRNANSYLSSPSGKQTFWTESRDGKSTMFIGDAQGGSGKQIATLSDYEPHGWFGDKYLLVSKKDSELYIMSVDGVKKDSEAVKVTDYHKPDYEFYGY